MWWVKLKVSEFIVEVPVYKGVPLVLGEVDAFSSLGLGLALKVRIDKLLLKVEEPLGISRASSVPVDVYHGGLGLDGKSGFRTSESTRTVKPHNP